MSGPKAFRIVTRAEIISICRRNLARLDAAIEIWTSTCRRNGTIDQSDIDKVIARRDESVACLTRIGSPNSRSRSPRKFPISRPTVKNVPKRRPKLRPKRKAIETEKGRRPGVVGEPRNRPAFRYPLTFCEELASSGTTPERLNAAIKGPSLASTCGRDEGVTERQRDIAGRLGAGETHELRAMDVPAVRGDGRSGHCFGSTDFSVS